MGLLDDAIRDHLELKRRHGADPGEVARIENEALSSARREAPAAEAEPEEAFADDLEADDDPLADLPYRDAEPDDFDDFEDEAPRAEHLDAPTHQHEPEPEAVYEVEPEALEPEPESPPAARSAGEREDDPQATQ